MEKKTNEILRYLVSAEKEMFGSLERLVTTQSHSFNKAGNDRMVEIIAAEFETSILNCETIFQENLGNHLVVRSPAVSKHPKQILLSGHTDTVFPEDTTFTWYRESDGLCRGPGVIDMKGGLVAGIYALKALEAVGLLRDLPITFIFNSDEEIGSRTSGSIIRSEARKSLFAFVLECGGLGGEIVTGRKGSMSIALETFGKAGHAATAVKDKASAILAMAKKIVAVEALNDQDRKISANVGKMEGGIGPNTVPDRAFARIDVRYERPEDRLELVEKLEKIAKTSHAPGTHAHWEYVSGRPPMPENPGNRRLFEIVKGVASDLNIQVKEEFRFGVSDANLVADENTPVLDGLGPVGAEDHSENEYMVKKSLPERTLLLAAAIDACWSLF